MAIAVVQAPTPTKAAAATSLSITLSATTSGNLLVVGVVANPDSTPGAPTVTVKLGATSCTRAENANNGAFVNADVWYLANIPGSQTTVTATSNVAAEMALFAYEISGCATSSPLDKVAGSTATGSPWSSGATSALSQAGEIAVGVQGGAPSASSYPAYTGPGSPWTNTATVQIGTSLHNAAIAGYDIVSSTSAVTYNGTATNLGNNATVVATFAGAATAGAAAMSAAASVSAANVETLQQAAALSAAASVSAAGVETLQQAAAMSVAASVSATGGFTIEGAAALSAAASLTAVPPSLPVPPPLASWSGSYSRDPVVAAPGAPSIAPLAIPVANTAGNWVFAVVSWRQDAGTAGTLLYPSTVSVSDDAHNFWIPVYSGPAATSMTSDPVTGIVRNAVWMAPAARAAEFVFVSPTAYQSAVTAYIFEYQANCPWYQVEVVTGSFTNQGTSVTLSQAIPGSVFAIGVIAWDNKSGSVTTTSPGWTVLNTQSTTNGTDDTGDLQQDSWLAVGTGGSLTLSASGTPSMDWADVIVCISGVTDTRAFPYPLPLENWPVLVTEIASGPALNQDPVFALGATFWTGTGASVAAVSWPLFQPVPSSYQTVLYGSLQVTPAGSASLSYAASEAEAVSPVVQYTATAWAYSPSGYGAGGASGLYAGIQWLTSGLSVISVTAGSTVTPEPGEWTHLSAGPVFPPQNAAYAQMVIGETGGGSDVPASAVFYAGYGSFGAADAYEAVPPDQIAWTDVSTRNFTQGDIEVSRGIQYEDQSLEAGTMTVYLANEDAAMMFGNVASPFWPNIGDTDVPIRLRAIWPGSLTPYVVMFSGFTDDVKYGWDTSEETWYGYAQVTASDCWSRLTQQMLAVLENEALIDNPVAFISCNQNGANTISTGQYSAAAQSILASVGSAPITVYPTASFTGGAISIPGASGLSCWQSGGTRAASNFGTLGYCLVWLPSAPLQVAPGLTIEFWYSPVSDWSAQAVTNVTVCQALGEAGAPLWTLSVDNGNPGADSFQSFLQITTPAGTTSVGSLIAFYSTTAAASANYYIAVSWTTTTVTVTVNPGDPELTETLTLTGQDFSTVCSGLSFGGVINPPLFFLNGFGDTAIADIAIFDYLMPPARSAARYYAGLTAFASDSDNWRLARVTGYAGFIPVLGMRGTDLPVPPVADVDLVTGATDTNTQVVSAYFTNEASSTLAAMFVDGPGTLIYRRRQEWYNRPIGQYVTGENDSQSLSLGISPLNASFSTAGWTTGNGATLTSGSGGAPGGALFVPSAGLFAGNGSTASPFIITTSNPAVTPGGFYQFTVWLYSAQGWPASGLNAQIRFYTSGNTLISTTSSPAVLISAGSVAYATAGPVQAPATAAYLNVAVQANATPPSTTGFYVAAARVSLVTPDYAAGAGAAVPEAPYLPDMHLGSDRAQLYNYAVLTQYGTNLISSFSGSAVLFTPSSGVIVTVTNTASAALRGQVPYTATIYLSNTAQAPPYYLNEGSIEDFGSWITQTLGSPLFRPDAITLTPAATPSALTTALQAEIGDTITFRRRPMGGPEIQIPSYYSKLTHNISKDKGTWTTEMELSPLPQGQILTCDDVVHGVLTGQGLLGW